MLRPQLRTLGLLLAATLLILAAPLRAGEPVKMIFDTDAGGDIDDALALAVIHGLQARGEVELLAVTCSRSNPYTPALIDLFNTWYGHPDIPIGKAVREIRPEPGRYLIPTCDAKDEDGNLLWPHDIRPDSEVEDAVTVLRRTLAQQPDHSVVLAVVGNCVNVAALLKSQPDEHSPLSGQHLAAAKVKSLSLMGGYYGPMDGSVPTPSNSGVEANIFWDVEGAREVFNRWPTEIYISSWELGRQIRFPWFSIQNDFQHGEKPHPLPFAYEHWSQHKPHDRPCWDLISVLYPVRPDRDYYDVTRTGRVVMDEKGVTRFEDNDPNANWWEKGHHYLLTASEEQIIRNQEAFVELASQPEPGRVPRDPVPVIFDTDMGNDIDDALALTLLHGLDARGECDLIAITSSKDHPASASFIDAVNRVYGQPDIPIGRVVDGAVQNEGRYNVQTIEHTSPDGKILFPHIGPDTELPTAVSVLRRSLASQPDGSVVMLVVGFSSNASDLLDSAPDEHSPLTGKELIEKKVKRLEMMAGSFDWEPKRPGKIGEEYNVVKDIPAAQNVIHNWPTPLYMSPWYVGFRAVYPESSIDRDFDPTVNPIPFAYRAYRRKPGDHPAFDLTSVLHAVRPDHGYFDLTEPGTIEVDDQGVTTFTPDPEGNRRVFKVTEEQIIRATESLSLLGSEPVGDLRWKP